MSGPGGVASNRECGYAARVTRPRSAFLVCALSLLSGCGGGDEGTGASDGTPGTRVAFDWSADFTLAEHFFDAPYPSDLRVDALGHPELAGFPNPKKLGVVDGLVQNAAEAVGFPVIPVAHFRFEGPVAPRSLDDLVAADVASPFLLVDIDASSKERGRLIPVIAETRPADPYVPENLLSLAPRPGFVLRAETRYAFVVLRSAQDADGKELGVPPALARLAAHRPKGDAEKRADELYAPMFETLETLGVAAKAVAAATVFTTGDVVAELESLSQKVLEKYDVVLSDLAEYPDAEAPELCILSGSVEMPEFQTGTPPFNTGGRIELDSEGRPVETRKEKAPFKIVLPKSPMPASGYPLLVNVHGSGGFSIAMVRPVGADGKPGLPIGPAFPYAHRGFAMAGMAMPVNPERLPGASETAYLNANNLAALRDTFRQGQIEIRLFLEALEKLEIPPSALGSCTGPSLPAGATAYRFDVDKIGVTGQSMGGMYTNIVAATEPHFKALVPTGAGGHWTHFIFHTPLSNGAFPGLLKLVLGGTEPLSFVHPVLAIGAGALEAADPIVYVPRVAQRPLPNHPVRPVYEPVAPEDSYFAQETYDAMALAFQHPQAGDAEWSSMQDALALAGLDGLRSLPLTNNLKSESGAAYTGAVLQFAPKGLPGEVPDGHAIYSRRDDVKYQYSCFMAEFFLKQAATIVPPKPDFTLPCEGL